MEWLDKLQAPGLILAGAVIYMQYRVIMWLLQDRANKEQKAFVELAENTRIVSRVAAILDLICKRIQK